MDEEWLAAIKENTKINHNHEISLLLQKIEAMQVTLIQAVEEIYKLETFRNHAQLFLSSWQYEQIEKEVKWYLLLGKIIN